EAVTAMDETADEVAAGVDRANESGQVLTKILASVETLRGQVDKIADAAQQMKAFSTQLTESTHEVGAVIEENVAATEEVAAQVHEVSASTQALNTLAVRLQELTQKLDLTQQS